MFAIDSDAHAPGQLALLAEGAARAEAALADIDRPRFTPTQKNRRPGNPLGEARLLAATAEAARWRMTKEDA